MMPMNGIPTDSQTLLSACPQYIQRDLLGFSLKAWAQIQRNPGDKIQSNDHEMSVKMLSN